MNRKKLLMFGIPILALMVVSAAVLTYYALFTVSVNVNQPISVTGDLEQTVLDCEAGETCLGDTITVSNSGDEARTVKIVNTIPNENVIVSYVGKLELTKKDTSTWIPLTDKLEVTYTVVGDEFEFSGVPEGYVLVYYKDKGTYTTDAKRLAVLGESGGFDESFPQSDDWNVGEFADYCGSHNGFDDYAHCKGAKLWVVPNGNIVDGVLVWSNPENFYFETDLVYYFDNAKSEITIPANSFITFYPAFTPDQHISGGVYNFVFEVQ